MSLFFGYVVFMVLFFILSLSLFASFKSIKLI